MAIFTYIAVSIIGLTAGSFIASAVAGVLALGASYGLSYAAKALSGNQTPTTDNYSVQGKLQAGGAVPRAFNLGYSVTAGSLVYVNTWGTIGKTPNAYLTQVIALQDLPGADLLEVWVNGEKVTFDGDPATATGAGAPVLQYRKDGADWLFVKYYDGSQTTADSFLTGVGTYNGRPYESTRVGVGVAYVSVTSLVNDKLFNGFPTFKFALSGIPLYDPSKDSTVGGSGSHRYASPATWGGDGDQFPAVQAYNILRGIKYNGAWLYGLQTMSAARLPAANWIAQIEKCRVPIQGEGGMEPTYRSGGQVNVDTQPANTLEAILTACQGRVSEIGGFYKIHLGAPDSASFTFTDGDILSTEEQVFTPFFGLADTINGIVATYPSPAEAWNSKSAPAYYRSDLEIEDGNRRLLANPAFDFVPYAAQVQRLQKSAVEEARRARRHTLVLPPAYWIIEPGDIGSWTSVRNGYVDKLFRVDGVADKANLDVGTNITEVDPSDYDWDHDSEFEPSPESPTGPIRPPPQGVTDWFVQPWIIVDADGISRRPAIKLTWDGAMPGVVGVAFAIRRAGDLEVVYRGRTDYVTAGAIIISQNLLPNSPYQVQGQYIPSAARDITPSSWVNVTTPDVRLSLLDFEAAVKDQVTRTFEDINHDIDRIEKLIASVGSIDIARNWLDKKEQRRELASVSGKISARVEETWTVATGVDAAFAQYRLDISAIFNDAYSRITHTITALSDLTQAVLDDKTVYQARFANNEALLGIEIYGRATGDSALSEMIQTLSAKTDRSFASVSSVLIAQADYNGSVAADLSSFNTKFNGHDASIKVLTASLDGQKVEWSVQGTIDGVTGGIAFTGIKTAAGVTYAFVVHGDVIVDGTIAALQIKVGGVEIQNLVPGAATFRARRSFAANTLPIQSVNILSGAACCTICSTFAAPNGTDVITLTLLVDGVTAVVFAINGRGSGTWTWDQTDLSAGVHAFQWAVQNATNAVNGVSVAAGQQTVTDLRR